MTLTFLPDTSCFALLDDCHASSGEPSSRLYTDFVREHRCADPDTLDACWQAVAGDMGVGLHALVLIDYEWGARMLRAGQKQLAPKHAGALRVLMFAQLQRLDSAQVQAWLAAREALELGSAQAGTEQAGTAPSPPAAAGVLELRPSVGRDAFSAAIERIHALIRAGETYQINYTYQLHFRSFGAPLSLYRRLRTRQPVGFGAFIALPPTADGAGGGHILSCSPELFLRHRGGTLQARPMKGTAARAQPGAGEGSGDGEGSADNDSAADREIAHRLGHDSKNRAENVMIVDLLRNDLGRIARTGSVRVPNLFKVERYATVFQMTSTVEAELAPNIGFPDVLRALFPCGSITGAPKHRSMHIIGELETTPRGLYTGSIGWIDPPPADAGAHLPASAQACGDFCLSVAIRTLCLDAADETGLRSGVMGVGAGIVIDSRAEDEFDECLLKARFLTTLDPGFTLFETMLASRERGIRHLERHLQRLQTSAHALGFAFDRSAIVDALATHCASLVPGQDYRLRLDLHHDGSTRLVAAKLEALPPGPVRVLLQGQGRGAALRQSPGSVPQLAAFIGHKTTLRQSYDDAIAHASRHGAFDMLFFNAQGQLTEGARSNVFALVSGQWLTPPLGAGVLPGVMRSVLLDDPAWNAREAALTLDDLRHAERIIVCNALRGAVDAVLVE